MIAFPGWPHKWLTDGVYAGPRKHEHLKSIEQLQPHEDDTFVHDYLYGCLSILDTKAAALLQYDSILLAASSLALASFPKAVTPGSITVFIGLVLSGLSSVLCLHVIWIHWTETKEFHNSHKLFVRLLEVRNRRTVAYRLAWTVSLIAMVCLICGNVIQRRL